MEWDIDFLGHGDNDFHRVVLFHGEQFELTRVPTGVVYRFMATLLSPFQIMSTMSTNTSTDLSGATVSCSSLSTHQNPQTSSTLMFPGKNTNLCHYKIRL